MIKPHKYLNFNDSVLVVGGKILALLMPSSKIKYNKLLEKLVENGDENVRIVFPEALSFLFLLGKLEYNQATDEVELII